MLGELGSCVVLFFLQLIGSLLVLDALPLMSFHFSQ